jgi:ectoine hydroxylase-related dioxygenase (phytanoyl-CoA dioxygenase family)
MNDYIQQIEKNGYCLIPQVFEADRVRKALRLSQEWYERTKDTLAENLPALAKNDPFVWNLQNKDHFFLELLFSAEEPLRILKHFLNDRWFKQIPESEPNYILRSFMARSSSKVLPMHIDSLVPYRGTEVFVMQMSIILEDQTVRNGCTFVVPGSHASGEYADQKAFEIAVPVESKAGDVVMWDSRIWHGTRENHSTGTRWAIIGTFVRWWIKQMFNIPANVPQEIYEKLTDSQKALLGYCSIPYNDETEGVDMKRGYDTLLPDVAAYRAFGQTAEPLSSR